MYVTTLIHGRRVLLNRWTLSTRRKLSLTFGYICALPFAACQVDVPSFFIDQGMPQRRRQAWAVMQAFFLVMFMIGHIYDMILQTRNLQEAIKEQEDDEDDEEETDQARAASLKEEEHRNVPQYMETEAQDPKRESSITSRE
jgi:hypothetical protein